MNIMVIKNRFKLLNKIIFAGILLLIVLLILLVSIDQTDSEKNKLINHKGPIMITGMSVSGNVIVSPSSTELFMFPGEELNLTISDDAKDIEWLIDDVVVHQDKYKIVFNAQEKGEHILKVIYNEAGEQRSFQWNINVDNVQRTKEMVYDTGNVLFYLIVIVTIIVIILIIILFLQYKITSSRDKRLGV